MSATGGPAAGLAYLPTWLTDAPEPPPLEPALCGWVCASGWQAAGLVWPVEPCPTLSLLARPDGVAPLAHPPAEVGDVMPTLRSGSPTVVWQVPGSAGRLYTLLSPAGRPGGLLWADRGPGEPWADWERNYLRLSARLIERSAVLAVRIGAVPDPARLSQRLADASLMAGRMAHDFDNILTGIIGFADLSVPLLPNGSDPARFVAEISKAGHRGIAFTQQLHQFSRSDQAKPTTGSVAAAVARVEDRLRPAMSAAVRVTSDIPPGLPDVAADIGPLGVVVGHLMENAADAMPAGGVVRVTARPVELTDSDAREYLGAVGPGPQVEITVEDAGSGIKPDVRAKLFSEPFFTTKPRHRGLGLAIVYRTLAAHRGGVRLDPVPPPRTGTRARVVLPPAARPAAVAVPPAAPLTIGG